MQHFKAILWLQFRLFQQRTKDTNKLVESILSITTIIVLIYMSLSLGWLTHFGFSRIMNNIEQIDITDKNYDPLDNLEHFNLKLALYIVILLLSIIWTISPIVALFSSSTTDQFDISKFLLFPISFQQLYNINLFANALDLTIMLFYPTLFVLWFLFSKTYILGSFAFAILLLIYVLLFIVWNGYITYYMTNLLRNRKIMERFLFISLILIILFSLLSSLFPQFISNRLAELRGDSGLFKLEYYIDFTKWLIDFTPPGLFTNGFLGIYYHNWRDASLSFIILFLLTLLGWYKGRKNLREFFIGKHNLPIITSEKSENIGWEIPFLPSPLIALIEKEIKYIFRSMIGKFSFFILPLLIILLFRFFIEVDILSKLVDILTKIYNIPSSHIILFLSTFIVLSINTPFFNNILGLDSYGLCNLYIFPINRRLIFVGKNIGIFIYFSLQFILIITFYSIFYTFPNFTLFIGIILLSLISIIIALIIGNFLSLFFPVKSSFRIKASEVNIIEASLSFSFSIIQLIIFFQLSLFWFKVSNLTIKISLLILFLIGIIALYVVLLDWYAKIFENKKEQILRAIC